jgi:hypothetical protein
MSVDELEGMRHTMTDKDFYLRVDWEQEKEKQKKEEATGQEHAQAPAQAPAQVQVRELVQEQQDQNIVTQDADVGVAPVVESVVWERVMANGLLERLVRPWLLAQLRDCLGLGDSDEANGGKAESETQTAEEKQQEEDDEAEVANMVSIVLEKLAARASPAEVQEELQVVLEEDASEVVRGIWRLLRGS